MPKKPGANSRIVIDGYLSYLEIGGCRVLSSSGGKTIEVLAGPNAYELLIGSSSNALTSGA